MALISCLQNKILNDRVLISENPNYHQAIDLNERQARMSVTITRIPKPFVAIRLRGHLSYLLKKGKNLNKICDYVLIYRLRAEYHAVLIELKSSLAKKEKGKEQLMRSLPILRYLLSVCKIECEIDRPVHSIKYVLISKKISDRLDKQPIKMKLRENTDEQYKQITVKTLIGKEFSINTLTH